jgi:branched-chain amino acid transport system permease protein
MPYLLAIGIVVLQQVFFGVPLGIFIRGVIIGLLTALVALGMALTYRANRFVNFAQGDLGTVPVVLMVMVMSAWGWSYGLSLAAGLVGAVVLGAVVELAIIRRFFKSPRLLLTVASLGLSQLLAAAALLMPKLWGASFPLLGQRLDPPFDMEVTIGTVVFNANDIMALVIAPIALVALAVFLRTSNIGVAIRASADSADRASLLGVPVKRLQTVVWSVASLLAFVAIFLRAGIVGLPIASALSIGVLLRALGALVLGRMSNLSAVAANAIALGILEVAVSFTADSPALLDPILAAIIVVALLLSRPRSGRVDEDSVSTWRSADDVRPIAPELAALPVVRAARWGLMLAVTITLLVLPQLLTVDKSLKASAVGIYAVLGLSVVVLTGWAGQVSLGQIGFFAIGATVGALGSAEWGIDLSLSLLLSAIVGAVVAVAVGLPALRRRGFYLAVTTLAFSLATTSYFLNPDFFDWVPTERVPRPPLFGRIDINSPTAIYYLVLAVLAICLFGLRGIRESRTGRALIAMRDNERGAQAFGLNATRTRLTAFALSGALASLAGCLFVHHQQAIGIQPYEPFENLIVFTMVIIGGVTVPLGAVLGALYLQGTQWFLPTEWQGIASGVGVLAILLVLPGGLGGLLYRLRDRWLARVATSHAIDAPGLATAGASADDIDPREIPLAEEPAMVPP